MFISNKLEYLMNKKFAVTSQKGLTNYYYVVLTPFIGCKTNIVNRKEFKGETLDKALTEAYNYVVSE